MFLGVRNIFPEAKIQSGQHDSPNPYHTGQ